MFAEAPTDWIEMRKHSRRRFITGDDDERKMFCLALVKFPRKQETHFRGSKKLWKVSAQEIVVLSSLICFKVGETFSNPDMKEIARGWS